MIAPALTPGTRWRRWWTLVAILLGFLALFAGALSARGQATADSLLDARTRELARQLRCPVCQGLSLEDSPSELSQEMRDVVREQLRAGRSADEVKQYFVARYGEWILMSPPPHGFNWLVYVLPLALLGAGAGGLTIAVRRWTRPASSPAAVEAPPLAEQRAVE